MIGANFKSISLTLVGRILKSLSRSSLLSINSPTPSKTLRLNSINFSVGISSNIANLVRVLGPTLAIPVSILAI